jgi:type III secretion protein R
MKALLASLLAFAPLAAQAGEHAVPVDANMASQPVSMLVLLAVMALLPFAAVMLTAFSKIAVVLSLARSAMGTQQAPPTIVLTGLAAVLSGHIMTPVVEHMYEAGRSSFRSVNSTSEALIAATAVGQPLREFLVKHGSQEERARFVDLARELRPAEESALVCEDDLSVVVPAFVITELKESFQIGFLIFLPFLVLDMVIANVLLALGMQTLSPSQVSLPFKILLFVAVDGWGLLAQGLILGYR